MQGGFPRGGMKNKKIRDIFENEEIFFISLLPYLCSLLYNKRMFKRHANVYHSKRKAALS